MGVGRLSLRGLDEVGNLLVLMLVVVLMLVMVVVVLILLPLVLLLVLLVEEGKRPSYDEIADLCAEVLRSASEMRGGWKRLKDGGVGVGKKKGGPTQETKGANIPDRGGYEGREGGGREGKGWVRS